MSRLKIIPIGGPGKIHIAIKDKPVLNVGTPSIEGKKLQFAKTGLKLSLPVSEILRLAALKVSAI